MKSERSVRSIKSNRSLRSLRTSRARYVDINRTDIIDLENILPIACAKFDCPYLVYVKKIQRNDDYYKMLKYGDTLKKRISMAQRVTKADTPSPTAPDIASTTESVCSTTLLNTLTVQSIYDTYNSLSEIRIENLKCVPRVLFRILCFLIPFYKNMTKITIANCKINGAIVYELSKILSMSTVTQICLDGSVVDEANFNILIDTTHLNNLSLSRCNIDDEVCELIASKLHMAAPGEKLSLLNLSSNHITDVGAASLADALRTNRYLRYLNVADNRITDNGAVCILRVLAEFPLTHDEIMKKRIRFFEYLRKRQQLFLQILDQTSDEVSQKPTKRKKSSTTSFKSKGKKEKEPSKHNDALKRADILAKEKMGPFLDPFQKECIKTKDGFEYCVGNMALSYLNISYNDLSYFTVKALKNVVLYQKLFIKRPPQTGLIKIVVDGNNLPITCAEMTFINEVLGNKYQEDRRNRGLSRVGG